MKTTIALIGNQNSGKTTLFNALTGSNQHVGNFPGVTVEQKRGKIKKHTSFEVVDLPGIYSLSPYTMEEIVSIDFLLEDRPDIILNIVDATNIERNLYLTMQLIELQIPMVIALNMMDEVISSGNCIDVEGLEEQLGTRVVPISAYKEEGIEELIESMIELSKNPLTKKIDLCHGEIHKAIHSISHLIEDNAKNINYPIKYCATKVIENDEKTMNKLNLDENQLHIIHHIIEDMEQKEGTDKDVALVEMRYNEIERICYQTVFKEQETMEQIRSEKIDKILTHKYLGIPIFIGIMLLIFFLTFNVLGEPLQGLLEQFVDFVTTSFIQLLQSQHVASWLISLLQDGVFAGVGSVF